MPFKNEAQRKACYAQASRDRKAGIEPRWNCHAYAHGEKSGKKKKIYTGPRGGKYYMSGSRKIYITQ